MSSITSGSPPKSGGPPRFKHPELWNSEPSTKEKNSRDLCREAERFFATQECMPVPRLMHQSSDPFEVFDKIFSLHRVACIGENHADHTKEWLTHHLAIIKEKYNVTIIFIENIPNIENLSIDQIQKEALKLDEEYQRSAPGRLIDLIQTGLKLGIRFVAIDTKASVRAGSKPDLPLNRYQRIIATNFTAQRIILATLEKTSGNSIALMGYDHGTTSTQEQLPGIECQILGVSELIDSPYIRLRSQNIEYSLPQPESSASPRLACSPEPLKPEPPSTSSGASPTRRVTF